jgi:hypothetical protein
MTRGLKMTTLVSLLQPAPEVVELFDDIMLMAEGEARGKEQGGKESSRRAHEG